MGRDGFYLGRYCLSWYAAACSATGLGTAFWAFVNWDSVCFRNLYYFTYGVFLWHVICVAAFVFLALITVALPRRFAVAPGQGSPAAYLIPGSALLAGVFLYLFLTAGPLKGVARVTIAVGFIAATVLAAVGLGFLVRFLSRRVKSRPARSSLFLSPCPYSLFSDV